MKVLRKLATRVSQWREKRLIWRTAVRIAKSNNGDILEAVRGSSMARSLLRAMDADGSKSSFDRWIASHEGDSK